MTDTIGQLSATFLSFALVVLLFASATLLGAATSPVSAHQHTFDEAPDASDEADFRVVLPNPTDHHPGNLNEANGSIQYFASGADAFEAVGAGDGVYLDTVIIDADWIDYSECSTPNTEAFGIDRGNNNDGIEYDEDLLEYQRQNHFRDDGITIWFYNFEDFAGNPPYMAPEDAIVAAQGAGSAAGACLTVTDEPGWYQIQGFTNGTVADNGPDERPSENAEQIGIHLQSNYLYVCDCEDEAEAREELGAPPNEASAETDEPATPTPAPEPVADETTPTPTPEPAADETTPTPASDDATGEDAASDEPAEADDGDSEPVGGSDEADSSGDGDAIPGGEADAGNVPMTPTPGDGPGFGPIAAVLALFASVLFAHRRH